MKSAPRIAALGMGLFFVAAAILMLEVSMTRIFSLVMWYHFAFFTISVALFGFAAAGLTVHLMPRVFRQERAPEAAFNVSLIFAVAVPLCFKLFTINTAQKLLTGLLFVVRGSDATDVGAGYIVLGILGMAALYLCAVLPFFIGGIVIAVLFRHFGDQASRIYFFDLVGAGLGCLATVPVLNWIGGPGAMVMVAVIALLGCLCFGLSTGNRRQICIASVLAVIAFAALFANPSSWMGLKYYRGAEETNIDYEKWNSFSRVAVEKLATSDSLLIEIDAASNTFVTHWDGDPASIAYLHHDLIAAQYALLEQPKVLAIGSGGGADILTALISGSRDITAVEVNPIIVDIMSNRYAEYSGDIYNAPEVRVVTDEARSYIRRSGETYDCIQAGYVDTYAATAAGAFALTENTLYTREAFSDYLAHLTENGIIAFQRYYEEQPQQGIRLVSIALAALAERGKADPSRHVAVLRHRERASVMVKNSPFTDAETERLIAHCEEAGLELVAAPGIYHDNLYGELLSASDPQTVIEGYTLDITPSTDDRPFFFYMVKPMTFWKGLLLRSGEYQHSRAVFLLTTLLFVVFLLSLFILIFPALRERHLFSRSTMPVLMYFGALGLGFMMVEIGMLQRLMLFLGHPTLALSVVLCSLLISAGLGSAWTARVPLSATGPRLQAYLWTVVGLTAITAFAWPPVFQALVGLERLWRVIIAIVTLFPVGFFLGTAFPVGIRRLASNRAELIPWAWAVNGATSVLGSVLAMVVAINSGFTVTLLVGAVCYLLAVPLARRTG
ncbi:MAG: hypothetical protein ABIF77_15670 [bacterium]